MENLRGKGTAPGRKLGFECITETWLGEVPGVTGFPARSSLVGPLVYFGIGEEGADLGSVTMTDGMAGWAGNDWFGKSLSCTIDGRFRLGSERLGAG